MVNWASSRVIMLLTNRCPFECRHCVRKSSPRESKDADMTPGQVVEILSAYRDTGGQHVSFSGGEPTLNMAALIKGLAFCRDNGIESTVTTNGVWGTASKVGPMLEMFGTFGVQYVTVSFDTYHAPFSDWANIQRILFSGSRYGLKTMLNWTSPNLEGALKQEIRELLGPVKSDLAMDKIPEPASVLAVGRAKSRAVVSKRNSCFPWYCLELKLPGPLVVIEPGRFWYRCGCANPAMGTGYTGSFVEAVEAFASQPYVQQLERYGLLPLMRARKALKYRDQCEFCSAEMGRWRAEVKNGRP